MNFTAVAVLLTTLFLQSFGELRQPVDCSKVDFTDMDKNCCRLRFGDLVSQSVMKTCNPKNDKNLAKWPNMFMMQKLMNPKLNNSIELNSTKVAALLCPAANFINCIATSIGWLQPNRSYNMEAANVLLKKNKNPDYVNTLLAINELTHPNYSLVHVAANKPYPCPSPKKNAPPVMTNLHPLFAVQHLHMYIPTFLSQQGWEDKSQKCVKNSEEFNYCVWGVYMSYDMNMRSQKEADSTIALLKKLDVIVAKHFPSHKHVELKRG